MPAQAWQGLGAQGNIHSQTSQCSLQSTRLRSHERFLKHHELCKHKVWSGTLISGAKPPRAVQVSANSGTQVHGTSKHCLTQTETQNLNKAILKRMQPELLLLSVTEGKIHSHNE